MHMCGFIGLCDAGGNCMFLWAHSLSEGACEIGAEPAMSGLEAWPTECGTNSSM